MAGAAVLFVVGLVVVLGRPELVELHDLRRDRLCPLGLGQIGSSIDLGAYPILQSVPSAERSAFSGQRSAAASLSRPLTSAIFEWIETAV